MSLKAVGMTLGQMAVRWLPRFLLKRLVPTDSLIEEVDIDLRSTNPINFALSKKVPELSVWLRITNRSLLEISLDRILMEIWVGQPLLWGGVFEPKTLEPRSTIEDVYFRSKLSNSQVEQIEANVDDGDIREISIQANAYFNSKSGPFNVETNLKSRDVSVTLPP